MNVSDPADVYLLLTERKAARRAARRVEFPWTFRLKGVPDSVAVPVEKHTGRGWPKLYTVNFSDGRQPIQVRLIDRPP